MLNEVLKLNNLILFPMARPRKSGQIGRMNDERLTELEIRFSHQDNFIRQLNEVVIEQQVKIEQLEKAVMDLKRNINSETGVDSRRTLADDKPPHY